MKKIALLHFAYPPNIGGVESLIHQHVQILSDLDYEVTIITGSGEETNPKIKIVVIPEFQSIVNFNPFLQEKILDNGIIDHEFYDLADQISQKLEKCLENIDIIIVHNMITIVRNLPFVYAFRNYVKKYPNKKYIGWIHDHSYINEFKIKDLDKVANSKVERELLTTPIKNVHYVAISESFREPFIKLMNLKQEDVIVIPNGLNLKSFLEIDDLIWSIMEKFSLTKAFPTILSPVNIMERKNLIYCIDIVAGLKKYYPNISYIITGNPSKHHSTIEYLNSLKERINQLSLQENVIFFNNFLNRAMVDSEIHDLYQFSDLVFFFSKSENFGLPLLEAFATKTPIFVSNLKVFKEVGKDLANYIDYKTIPADKAAEIIHDFLKSNKLIKSNYLTKSHYDLKTIIKEQLVPILE